MWFVRKMFVTDGVAQYTRTGMLLRMFVMTTKTLSICHNKTTTFVKCVLCLSYVFTAGVKVHRVCFKCLLCNAFLIAQS